MFRIAGVPKSSALRRNIDPHFLGPYRHLIKTVFIFGCYLWSNSLFTSMFRYVVMFLWIFVIPYYYGLFYLLLISVEAPLEIIVLSPNLHHMVGFYPLPMSNMLLCKVHRNFLFMENQWIWVRFWDLIERTCYDIEANCIASTFQEKWFVIRYKRML